ncbi:hypothetical protein BDY19DRAFT_904909 [Irpex rosettiformis]|uniref:Uncharacterized protein n=1 Tax=Irpex rosettiformis TaxID=378272 RepID=A0ACB8U8Q6_9APHY|nr:hypothetical protein BDY19DRAFT_904909 [Irpex rosettiformis]
MYCGLVCMRGYRYVGLVWWLVTGAESEHMKIGQLQQHEVVASLGPSPVSETGISDLRNGWMDGLDGSGSGDGARVFGQRCGALSSLNRPTKRLPKVRDIRESTCNKKRANSVVTTGSASKEKNNNDKIERDKKNVGQSEIAGMVAEAIVGNELEHGNRTIWCDDPSEAESIRSHSPDTIEDWTLDTSLTTDGEREGTLSKSLYKSSSSSAANVSAVYEEDAGDTDRRRGSRGILEGMKERELEGEPESGRPYGSAILMLEDDAGFVISEEHERGFNVLGKLEVVLAGERVHFFTFVKCGLTGDKRFFPSALDQARRMVIIDRIHHPVNVQDREMSHIPPFAIGSVRIRVHRMSRAEYCTSRRALQAEPETHEHTHGDTSPLRVTLNDTCLDTMTTELFESPFHEHAHCFGSPSVPSLVWCDSETDIESTWLDRRLLVLIDVGSIPPSDSIVSGRFSQYGARIDAFFGEIFDSGKTGGDSLHGAIQKFSPGLLDNEEIRRISISAAQAQGPQCDFVAGEVHAQESWRGTFSLHTKRRGFLDNAGNMRKAFTPRQPQLDDLPLSHIRFMACFYENSYFECPQSCSSVDSEYGMSGSGGGGGGVDVSTARLYFKFPPGSCAGDEFVRSASRVGGWYTGAAHYDYRSFTELPPSHEAGCPPNLLPLILASMSFEEDIARLDKRTPLIIKSPFPPRRRDKKDSGIARHEFNKSSRSMLAELSALDIREHVLYCKGVFQTCRALSSDVNVAFQGCRAFISSRIPRIVLIDAANRRCFPRGIKYDRIRLTPEDLLAEKCSQDAFCVAGVEDERLIGV